MKHSKGIGNGPQKTLSFKAFWMLREGLRKDMTKDLCLLDVCGASTVSRESASCRVPTQDSEGSRRKEGTPGPEHG